MGVPPAAPPSAAPPRPHHQPPMRFVCSGARGSTAGAEPPASDAEGAISCGSGPSKQGGTCTCQCGTTPAPPLLLSAETYRHSFRYRCDATFCRSRPGLRVNGQQGASGCGGVCEVRGGVVGMGGGDLDEGRPQGGQHGLELVGTALHVALHRPRRIILRAPHPPSWRTRLMSIARNDEKYGRDRLGRRHGNGNAHLDSRVALAVLPG